MLPIVCDSCGRNMIVRTLNNEYLCSVCGKKYTEKESRERMR